MVKSINSDLAKADTTLSRLGKWILDSDLSSVLVVIDIGILHALLPRNSSTYPTIYQRTDLFFCRVSRRRNFPFLFSFCYCFWIVQNDKRRLTQII